MPLSCSFFKNRFNSKKLGLVISSLSSLSQLSCRLSISITRRCFCSSLRVAIHFFFHSLCAAGAGVGDDAGTVGREEAGASAEEGGSVEALESVTFGVVGVLTFGGPKKEVMEALVLGFLASERGSAVVALRLRDIVSVRRKIDRILLVL